MKHDEVVDLIKKNMKKESIQFTVVSAEADLVNPDRDQKALDNGEKIFNLTRTTGFGFSLSSKNISGEGMRCFSN